MKNVIAIARRELGTYFTSPIAYVVTAALLAIAGFMFERILFFSREATLRYLFTNLATILLFVAPALTMRLLAEERRSGTIELLLTAPVRDWEVIWGKWLASFILFLAMLSLTLVYPLVLERFGDPDWGPIGSGYLGLILLGGALLALGTLTSTLTRNQIIAAVLGVALCVGLWLIAALAESNEGALNSGLRYLALGEHFFDFLKGVVDTRDVIYYLSVIAGALFLATRVLETRRWR